MRSITINFYDITPEVDAILDRMEEQTSEFSFTVDTPEGVVRLGDFVRNLEETPEK